MARPKVGEERREAIFAALEACIVAKGLAKTTLVDVAHASGLPRPLVRYFIGNRAEMIDALINRLLERGERSLRNVPRGNSIQEITDFLFEQAFGDETTNIVIMELWHLALRDASLRARLAAIYERLIFEIAALTSNQIDEVGGRDGAFAAVSLAFGAAFFGHLGVEAAAQPFLSSSTRQLLTQSHQTIKTGA